MNFENSHEQKPKLLPKNLMNCKYAVKNDAYNHMISMAKIDGNYSNNPLTNLTL